MKKTFCSLLPLLCALFAGAVLASAAASAQAPPKPIRVAVVGLVHGHALGILPAIAKDPDVQLVGVVEPNKALAQQYAARFHLNAALFYTELQPMLRTQHPQAVLVYTSIADHRRVIEAAAREGVASMVEKPLATTMDDALAIRAVAREHHVPALVNYETTWYRSNAEVLQAVQDGRLGTVRKVVVHDGHEGPAEIGVGPEFLSWLTDPQQNGAGALFDFGCYGADLATVMMHGAAPITVTAVVQTDKPQLYPHVDDDATVILRYPGSQVVLMPSWDWSFARKDMEVYGTDGLMVAEDPEQVRVRLKGQTSATEQTAPALPAEESGSLAYLAAVLRGQVKPQGDLSALDTNMVVMQILSAARESAQTGRTVTLQALPR